MNDYKEKDELRGDIGRVNQEICKNANDVYEGRYGKGEPVNDEKENNA